MYSLIRKAILVYVYESMNYNNSPNPTLGKCSSGSPILKHQWSGEVRWARENLLYVLPIWQLGQVIQHSGLAKSEPTDVFDFQFQLRVVHETYMYI